jgi:peptidoglycan hydrolase-like protein with peptidoglycan-binding domain
VVVVALGVGTAVVGGRIANGQQQEQEPPPQVRTAVVERATLREEETESGTLGHGPEHSLAGAKPGVVTELPAPGAVVDRGQSLYRVDAKPVPLLLGGVPLYRKLFWGVERGPDVRVLEENLAALGYTGFGAPDEQFTGYTATAVSAWQKSLGLERTGAVEPADVVVEPAPVRVVAVLARTGAPAAGELLRLSGTDRVVTVKLDATKQKLAQAGTSASVTVVGGTPTTGTVRSVSTAAELSESGRATVAVEVVLDDPAAAGPFDSAPAEVTFTREQHENVLAVPVGALLALAEGGYGVEVVGDGGERTLTAVTTGVFSGGRVEVSGDGVREGQRVVTTS